MVKNVILSVNESYDYYGILPIVSAAYRKYYPESKLIIGALSTIPAQTIKAFKKYCDSVIVLARHPEYPTCNQGKMMRFYIASQYGKETCMINDIDTIPLQGKFFVERFAKRPEGVLLAIGAELYKKTINKGKFPISYMAAEGYVFNKLFSTGDKTWEAFIDSFKNVKKVDGKENLKKPLGVFSDESLIRVIKGGVKILHLPRIYRPAIDSIARRSKFSAERLKKGGYFEAHHLHPIQQYKNRLIAIAQYLKMKEPYFICR
jgi:hypothetical protein